MPIGPVGKPTERALVVNSMVFAYTQYPNAAKEYLRFMMEEEQYVPSGGEHRLLEPPLQAYDASAVWTDDPKYEPYKSIKRRSGTATRAGRAPPRRSRRTWWSSRCWPRSAPGQATREEAAAEAQRRAKRYFRKV